MAWKNAYLVLWSVIEVIKENATQASSLVAVLAQEVVICPLLELWVVCRVVIITHALHTPHQCQKRQQLQGRIGCANACCCSVCKKERK